MKSLYSMFLSQAYQDCWDDYNRSMKLKNFPRWDYVILTASNDHQTEGFRRQIEERKEYLPSTPGRGVGAIVAFTITTVAPRCTQTEPAACSQYLPNSSVSSRPARSMLYFLLSIENLLILSRRKAAIRLPEPPGDAII